MSQAISRSRIDTAELSWGRGPVPRHLILDRDGVLNREAPNGGYVTTPGEWVWLPGAREGLRLLTEAAYRISVATNQSGVGQGRMTLADLDAVHERMLREAGDAGARIDAVFSCTHAPDAGCLCRKPAPGLIVQAMGASGIPPAETLVVGDDLRDLEAAAAAGVPAVLVLTGKGGRSARAAATLGVRIFEDLRALGAALVAESQEKGSGNST